MDGGAINGLYHVKFLQPGGRQKLQALASSCRMLSRRTSMMWGAPLTRLCAAGSMERQLSVLVTRQVNTLHTFHCNVNSYLILLSDRVSSSGACFDN